MAIQSSPGVQVVEKDYTQIVPTVSTSTGAFAGVFKWGPVEQPTLVASESDLLAVYGRPNDSNYQSFFTVKNFLEYSKQMYVTRVDAGSGRNAVAIKSGPISKVEITSPGEGYTVAPIVVFEELPGVKDGIPATAEAILTGAPITSVTVLAGGSGYNVGDVVVLSRPEQTLDTGSSVPGTEYVNAKVIVTEVSETGAIVQVSFEETGATPGFGYIDASNITYTVLNSTETASSTGINAILQFSVGTSSVKSVRIISGGSGYLDSQSPIQVSFVRATEGLSDFLSASAIATVSAVGAKIKNATHYETSWSSGQGSFGEFAAKYMGEMGNSISVSMCDNANWSTPVNGLFNARATVESVEEEKEMIVVRRVLNNEISFSNEALDAGQVLRTTSGKLIGEIAGIDTNTKYRRITLASDTSYVLTPGLHVKNGGYGSQKNISRISRADNGIVTVETTTMHGLVEGQYVSVSSNTQNSINVENTVILAVTNNTISYQTDFFQQPISERADTGTIVSKSQGMIDGFVKVWNDETDQYELSNRQIYVTVANDSVDNDFAPGRILFDFNGNNIGVISAVDKVQTIFLKSISTNDVYGEQVFAEWKYKSRFSANAPTTSSYAAMNGASYDELHVVVFDNDGRLTGSAGTIIEQYANLSKASDARNLSTGKSIYYKDVINTSSKWIWVLDHTYEVEEDSTKTDWGQEALGKRFKEMTIAVTRNLSGGSDTVGASAANYINAYSLYSDPSSYNISLVPLGHLPSSTVKSIVSNVIEKRRDCIAFFSPPLLIGDTMENAQATVDYRNETVDSSFAVMDSGWKYQYDKYSDKFRWIPLSGDIAGLCAYTDAVSDPWFSPGGFNRGQIKNVTKLAFNPTLAQRDLLYTNGVNPVVTFPAEGTILYGDKTLARKASAFDRINVRRLFIVLEKAVSTASKYQLFEFNDEFTRAQFRSLVEPYLRDVQGRRGIVDFLVKCDTSNNTPEVIDRNEFIADIYVKPNRSINFITLNFIATKTGVDFSEIGA